MTIEEQITIFEHNTEHERKEGDLNSCLNFRQLAEWLKELQAHREAWEKVTGIISKWKDSVGGVVVSKDAFSDILDLITDFRPKEGESNDSSNN